MLCPDENILLELCTGQLPANRREQLEEHLARCQECRALVAAMARAAPAVSLPATPAGSTSFETPDFAGAPAKSPSPPMAALLQAGDVIDGFAVVRLIGRGGMGDVYLARDTKLGRKVALKLVRPDMIGSRQAMSRFLVEARITASFAHPHIVTVYAVGEHRGCPYLALEYLEGQTLQERLEEEHPSLGESVRIGLAIAEALREAHARNVLHCDLKPANVIIPRDGRLRVLDFGLATTRSGPTLGTMIDAGGSATSAATLLPGCSHGDAVCGSPLYMAPEQWLATGTSAASDVWALGVVLFQLLTGKLPYRAPTLLQLREQVIGPEPAPPVQPVEPGAEPLTELVRRCLQKDPALRPTAAVVSTVLAGLTGRGRKALLAEASPFRGLQPFAERHAELFFGREAEVAAALERLREQALLVVAGPSGVGKSSFVQAGLVPELREQARWQVLQLRPGAQPMLALAERVLNGDRSQSVSGQSAGGLDEPPSAVAESREQARSLEAKLHESPQLLSLTLQQLAQRESCRVLLFVDQLEELFTQVPEVEERRRFLAALGAASDDPASPVRVVVTVRDDFLYRLAEQLSAPGLGEVSFLRPPDDHVLHEILRRPLDAVGYDYDDPALVGEMVEAVRAEQAALPLLQFVARRLWETRDTEARCLRRSAYQAMGGVAGALARHADGVLEGLSPSEVALTRELLLRLVTAEGARRTLARRRVLEGLPAEARGLLDRLTAARLVTARRGSDRGGSEAELELVHESLLRVWARLARWLEESRDGLAFLAEVNQSAELWDRRGRRPEELWQGEAIIEAQRRLARTARSVPEPARGFIEAGLRREASRRRRQRWRRALLVGALLLLATSSLLVAVALQSGKQEAERHKHRSQEQERAANLLLAEALRENARSALAAGEPLAARAGLRRSLDIEDSLLGRALWRKLEHSPLLWRRDLGTVIHGLALSPDGRLLAAAGRDRAVHLIELGNLQDRTLLGSDDQVMVVAFSPDGKSLATGSWSGRLRLWDLGSGRSRQLGGHRAGIYRVVFSPDGRTLASSSGDRTIRLWDIASGALRRELSCAAPVFDLAFSPDRKQFVSAGRDGARLFELDSGSSRPLGAAQDTRSVRFSPEGSRLAVATSTGIVQVWKTAGPTLERELDGGAVATDLAFSADGNRLAVAGRDGSLQVQPLSAGLPVLRLPPHGALASGVSFSPDGNVLFSASHDQTVRAWNLRAPASLRGGGHRRGVVGACFSPDGRQIASAGADRSIILWDTASGQPLLRLEGHADTVSGVAFSADGRRLFSSSYDGTVRVWDPRSGRALTSWRGHAERVRGVAISPDGGTVASFGDDGILRLWEAESGRLRHAAVGHQGAIVDARFSPDGRLLASCGVDRSIHLWDAHNARSRGVLSGHERTLWGLAFTPDGRQLVSAGEDGTIRLWDIQRRTGRLLLGGLGRSHWLDIDPAGRRVGAPLADGSARIIDLDGRVLAVLNGHRGDVDYLRFSPDGRLALTSGDDGTVRLWHAADGSPAWAAPALLGAPPSLLNHRGWRALTGGPPPATAWRQAAAARARLAADSSNGATVCLASATSVELWDAKADRRIGSFAQPGVRQLLALPSGCLGLAGAQLALHSVAGTRNLLGDVRGIALDGDGALVVAGPGLVGIDSSGRRRSFQPLAPGVVLVLRLGERLAMGHRDGRVLISGTAGTSLRLEETPASPVVSLLEGPAGTLIAGHADGSLGLWELLRGRQLDQAQLHGAPLHLLRVADQVYAASELGDYLGWDLALLSLPYCELLDRIWRPAPFGDAVTLRRPHRCSIGSPSH